MIQTCETREDRQNALNQLVVIDGTLDSRYEQFMKVKDKPLKKKLVGQLMDCKQRSSHVIGLLRGLQDLSQLSNEVIAKLNDQAYKAIQKTHL